MGVVNGKSIKYFKNEKNQKKSHLHPLLCRQCASPLAGSLLLPSSWFITLHQQRQLSFFPRRRSFTSLWANDHLYWDNCWRILHWSCTIPFPCFTSSSIPNPSSVTSPSSLLKNYSPLALGSLAFILPFIFMMLQTRSQQKLKRDNTEGSWIEMKENVKERQKSIGGQAQRSKEGMETKPQKKRCSLSFIMTWILYIGNIFLKINLKIELF